MGLIKVEFGRIEGTADGIFASIIGFSCLLPRR